MKVEINLIVLYCIILSCKSRMSLLCCTVADILVLSQLYLLQTAHIWANTGVVQSVVLLQARMWSPRQVTHFECRLVGYFTSPGKDTRQKGPTAFSVSSERHRDTQYLMQRARFLSGRGNHYTTASAPCVTSQQTFYKTYYKIPVSMFRCVKRQPVVIYNINATQ